MHEKLLFFLLVITALSCTRNALDLAATDATLLDRIPQEALLAFYPFDGDMEDVARYMHTGIPYGATLGEDRFGQPAHALVLDGIDDFVNLEAGKALQVAPPLSITYWVKVDQNIRTAAAVNLNHNTQANAGIFTSFDSNGGNPAFSINDAGAPGIGSRNTKHAGVELIPGRWYHVAGLIAGIDSMQIFIDGEEVSGRYDGYADSLVYVDGPVTLGRKVSSRNGPTLYFAGMLDEIAIYHKLLTSTEVQQLYRAGGSLP
ncbi:MAG: LamG domain-containing protein [Bacteroidota bacterium]